jgi:hypothetical protein
MFRLTRLTALFLLIGTTICFFPVHADSPAMVPDVLRFDAQWWKEAKSDEQQGFIYGYIDCRKPAKAAKASINDYRDAVTTAMNSQRSRHATSVTQAIEHAWKSLESQPSRKNAEVFAGPHGFLDGEWWGGFSGPWPPNVVDADRGYLEGYLECASAPVTIQAVRRYQTAINRHYASGHHDHDKIANVIQSLLKYAPGAQN